MTAGVEGVELGQEGVWEWFELGSGGANGFQRVVFETLSDQARPLVPLGHRSLEDEQPVTYCHSC